MFVAEFAELLPKVREPLLVLGDHPFLVLVTSLPVRFVIIEAEISVGGPSVQIVWGGYEMATATHRRLQRLPD